MVERPGSGGPIGLLWLIDSLTLGGAEALTAEFARSHDSDRWRLSIGYLKSIGGNRCEALLEESGVPVIPIGARDLRDLRAFRRLLRVLRERGIELVHSHLAYSSIWAAAAERVCGIPTLASFHVLPGRESWRRREGIRRRILVRAVDRWATGAVAVSEAVRAAWESEGIRPGKIRVVPNGVDLSKFVSTPELRARVRARLGWDDCEPLILTVAVLRAGKGVEVALEAVARARDRLPRIRLAVAGDGPEREKLRERSEALGLGGRVDWLGFRDDVGDLLAAADLFLLASRDDAFPTVLLEALAAGRTVVASRSGGIPEIVVEGTGRLVEPGDVDGFVAAICELALDPGASAALAAAGRQRAMRRFSVKAWCDRLDDVYLEALAARRAGCVVGASG